MKRRVLPWLRLLVWGLVFALPFQTTGQVLTWAQEPAQQDTKSQSLKKVLSQLEKRFKVTFAFDERVIQPLEVSSPLTGNSLDEILTGILPGLNLTYKKVREKLYVIQDRSLEDRGQPPVLNQTDPVPQLRGAPSALTITGRVTNDNGEGLPGVNVLLKGTATGTATNPEGDYSLTIPDNQISGTLVFSYIGYVTEEAPINNQTVINVSLVPDIKSLSEVVVVGYGTQKKSDLTGAVSSVKSEELTAYPATSVVQSLQGRAAGVTIQSTNGEPGAGFKVRIRGGTSINASSDPLYVVDGFVGGALPPPEDVESVEVLKDASSTAIYGSRGANGVILITTKKGRKGKSQVTINTSYAAQEVIKKLDLLEARDFAEYVNEVKPGFYDLNTLTHNTNWQDEAFRRGMVQNNQLSFSGGNDNINYYVSGVYYNQTGIIKNSAFNRFSLTSNLGFKVSDRVKIGLNSFIRSTNQDGVLTQQGGGGANDSGVISAAYRFEPTSGILDENGNYTLSRVGVNQFDNPIALYTGRISESAATVLQSNVNAQFTLSNNLTFNTTIGFKIDNEREGNYSSKITNAGAAVGGTAGISANKNANYLSESYFTYSRNFNEKHNFVFTAGYSFQNFRSEAWRAAGAGFITDAFSFWDLDGGSTLQVPASSLISSKVSSFYGRINYKLNDKYLLTFTSRYDGASAFSKNNKWAFFPSGAVAWNIARESFMSNIPVIHDLKLRGSYGITGNQAIEPYQSLARFSTILALMQGNILNAVVPATLANNDLTWETTAQTDVGLDIGLAEGRVNFSADYYYKKTSDLLFAIQLPQFSGFASQLQNIGKVENKGLEFTANTRNLAGAFIWSTTVNLSFNRNKILSLPGDENVIYNTAPGHFLLNNGTNILQEGKPVGSFYGYVYDGVYQEGDAFLPGAGFEQVIGGEKYKDLNGDAKLDSEDRTIIGNPHPKYVWGLSNDVSWKNFDLNIFFQSSVGNDVLNYTRLDLDRLAANNNATTDALKRWTPDNTNTDVPKASLGRAYRVSTRWVEDGSYIRLKNIALGYNIPKTLVSKVKLRQVRIYVSAQNALTFTHYKGVDPEVGYRSGGGTAGNRNVGLDFDSYPNTKTYTLGLNMGL